MYARPPPRPPEETPLASSAIKTAEAFRQFYWRTLEVATARWPQPPDDRPPPASGLPPDSPRRVWDRAAEAQPRRPPPSLPARPNSPADGAEPFGPHEAEAEAAAAASVLQHFRTPVRAAPSRPQSAPTTPRHAAPSSPQPSPRPQDRAAAAPITPLGADHTWGGRGPNMFTMPTSAGVAGLPASSHTPTRPSTASSHATTPRGGAAAAAAVATAAASSTASVTGRAISASESGTPRHRRAPELSPQIAAERLAFAQRREKLLRAAHAPPLVSKEVCEARCEQRGVAAPRAEGWSPRGKPPSEGPKHEYLRSPRAASFAAAAQAERMSLASAAASPMSTPRPHTPSSPSPPTPHRAAPPRPPSASRERRSASEPPSPPSRCCCAAAAASSTAGSLSSSYPPQPPSPSLPEARSPSPPPAERARERATSREALHEQRAAAVLRGPEQRRTGVRSAWSTDDVGGGACGAGGGGGGGGVCNHLPQPGGAVGGLSLVGGVPGQCDSSLEARQSYRATGECSPRPRSGGGPALPMDLASPTSIIAGVEAGQD